MVRRVALVFAALALAPASAAAAPVAEVLDPDGSLVTRANAAPYASPGDYGYLLTIGWSRHDAAGVELGDVSVLGGRIRVADMFVPSRGTKGARIDGVQIQGTHVRAGPNTLVPVGDAGYAVFLQQAALPGRRGTDLGVVGMRVVVANRQILVGLAPQTPRPTRASRNASPMLLLGLAPLSTVGGPALASEPLLPLGGGVGGRAVALARRFLGVPYVWGGATPFGFDCSGLAMYVYAQLGIHLSHFTGAQWNEGTRILSPDQLLPGDLVFFHPQSYGPGHEGIYIGGGQFIHAPHTGDVVKISSLDDPSYSFSYVGAVRPY